MSFMYNAADKRAFDAVGLSTEELAALRLMRKREGRNGWKARLRVMWESGSYRAHGYEDVACTLQYVRNRLGPSWLNEFRLPADGVEFPWPRVLLRETGVQQT